MAMTEKPHAVCIPYPAQGHINPMLKLAKLPHFKGFHRTFVNSEYNHRRLLKSIGLNSLIGFPDFCFETIPDGLPPNNNDDNDATQDVVSLCISTANHCLTPFLDLLHKLNTDASSSFSVFPAVTCVIADVGMTFGLEAAEQLGIPGLVLAAPSACSTLANTQCNNLTKRGLLPLKDEGCLESIIDWIPGMKNIPLKYLPSFLRTANPNDMMINYIHKIMEKRSRAFAIIHNTFDSFAHEVLESLLAVYPRIYSIGPLPLLVDHITDDNLKNLELNLWEEQPGCIEWLDSQEPNSVIYVCSIAIMTPHQLTEFAWGLANSDRPFLWIIRPDAVAGVPMILPPEFVSETKDRGLITGWCPQEQVLKHPSIGVFLSHMGWNSTLESVSAGVPMLCWPFFADQHINCWFVCNVWGIGVEIDNDVKRDQVEKLVRELANGEKGRELKRKAMEWKVKAESATRPGGSSYQNLDKLLQALLGNKGN